MKDLPKHPIERKKSISVVLELIEEELLSLHDICIEYKIVREDKITQELIGLLNSNTRENYPLIEFRSQYQNPLNDSSRSVDIGTIHSIPSSKRKKKKLMPQIAFFVIECKRLPSSHSEQYVKGNTGGIERFKRNIHGTNLSQSAIIGYIQKKDFCHWHKMINKWIDDLYGVEIEVKSSIKWNTRDRIKKLDVKDDTSLLAKCKSKHVRKSNLTQKDHIELFHFWIKLHDD